MKDFAAEIRAHLDVEHFLSQAQLMLDVQETNMEQILDSMLHHLLDKEETSAAFQDATKVLFTDSSGIVTWCLSFILVTHLCHNFIYFIYFIAVCYVHSLQKQLKIYLEEITTIKVAFIVCRVLWTCILYDNFINFQQAFDSVWQKFPVILRCFGIPEELFTLLEDIYSIYRDCSQNSQGLSGLPSLLESNRAAVCLRSLFLLTDRMNCLHRMLKVSRRDIAAVLLKLGGRVCLLKLITEVLWKRRVGWFGHGSWMKYQPFACHGYAVQHVRFQKQRMTIQAVYRQHTERLGMVKYQCEWNKLHCQRQMSHLDPFITSTTYRSAGGYAYICHILKCLSVLRMHEYEDV